MCVYQQSKFKCFWTSCSVDWKGPLPDSAPVGQEKSEVYYSQRLIFAPDILPSRQWNKDGSELSRFQIVCLLCVVHGVASIRPGFHGWVSTQLPAKAMRNGRSALHYACQHGALRATRVFLVLANGGLVGGCFCWLNLCCKGCLLRSL